MPLDFRQELKLVEGPSYPEHIVVGRDRIPYHTAVDRTPAAPPATFSGPARPEHPDGPPWDTLIYGLETNRFDTRARFLAQLSIDAASGQPIERYGDVLTAAFSQIYGGRGETDDTPGFLAWLRDAIANEREEAIRTCLARGLEGRRGDIRGRDGVSFDMETGHLPASHALPLYWMSALVPGWEQVVFDQTSDADDESAPHMLHAWWAGRRFDACADNLGDFVDAWSCAGLINTILRDVAKCDHRVALEVDEQIARATACLVEPSR